MEEERIEIGEIFDLCLLDIDDILGKCDGVYNTQQIPGIIILENTCFFLGKDGNGIPSSMPHPF